MLEYWLLGLAALIACGMAWFACFSVADARDDPEEIRRTRE